MGVEVLEDIDGTVLHCFISIILGEILNLDLLSLLNSNSNSVGNGALNAREESKETRSAHNKKNLKTVGMRQSAVKT